VTAVKPRILGHIVEGGGKRLRIDSTQGHVVETEKCVIRDRGGRSLSRSVDALTSKQCLGTVNTNCTGTPSWATASVLWSSLVVVNYLACVVSNTLL